MTTRRSPLPPVLEAVLPERIKNAWARAHLSPSVSGLMRGTLWSALGAISARSLTLVASIVVARLLGQERFGEFGIIASTVGMFAVFASLGMGTTATKHVAEFRVNDPAKAGRIIALSSLVAWSAGLLLTAAVLVGAPWLARTTLGAPHLSTPIRIAAVVLLFGAVGAAQTGALSGLEAFKRISFATALSGLLSVPLTIALTAGFGLPGAAASLAASQAMAVLINHLSLRAAARHSGVTISCRGSTRESKLIWTFGLPTVLSSAMVGPVTWIANAFIVNQPGGYAEMGVFNAANQWRNAIVFLPGLLAGVSLPILTRLRGGLGPDRPRSVLRANLRICFGVSLLAAIPVALLSPWIMSSYGPGFGNHGRVLVMLCVTSVAGATLNVIGQLLASEARMWTGFCLNLIWGSVLLGTCWALRHHGALGLALANLAAYGVHLLTVTTYVRWRLHGLL